MARVGKKTEEGILDLLIPRSVRGTLSLSLLTEVFDLPRDHFRNAADGLPGRYRAHKRAKSDHMWDLHAVLIMLHREHTYKESEPARIFTKWVADRIEDLFDIHVASLGVRSLTEHQKKHIIQIVCGVPYWEIISSRLDPQQDNLGFPLPDKYISIEYLKTPQYWMLENETIRARQLAILLDHVQTVGLPEEKARSIEQTIGITDEEIPDECPALLAEQIRAALRKREIIEYV